MKTHTNEYICEGIAQPRQIILLNFDVPEYGLDFDKETKNRFRRVVSEVLVFVMHCTSEGGA